MRNIKKDFPNLVVRYTDGEFRITARDGSKEWKEAIAYYTNDPDDAYDTALAMFKELTGGIDQ